MAELAKDTQTQASRRMRARNDEALRVLVLPIQKREEPAQKAFDEGSPYGEAGYSKTVAEDPFEELGGRGDIIQPPYELLTLAMLPEHSSEITPLVDAMEINIEGFGHHFVPRVNVDTESVPSEIAQQIKRERVRLTNFFTYANLRDSFPMLRRKMRRDLEVTGNAYWEVIRNAAGAIQGFEHVPSYQVRLGRVDKTPVEVEIPTLQLQEDDSVRLENVRTWQRFRPYVQSTLAGIHGGSVTVSGGRFRWFKEFGDPRVWDNETGAIVPFERVTNWDGRGTPMPFGRRANELVHFKLYSTRSPYGLPRYIGNLLSIFGARAAEEINYITFKNNNIPSMAVLVSNGNLTQGSVDRITQFVETKIQGSDNYSKFLVIEAEGLIEGDETNQVKLEMKPLVEAQHKDALFQNYATNCRRSIRRSWRVAPVFIGDVDEYSRATAESARRLADEQVFAPEREEFDNFVNRRLFPEMGVIYHKFRSGSPNTTDNSELVSILSGAEKTGGMTPRIARTVLEDILGRELPPLPKDERFDPDVPFSLLMAEAVKNMADPAEPGQQVTAIKRDAHEIERLVERLVRKHMQRQED